jgi:hypothetical protein
MIMGMRMSTPKLKLGLLLDSFEVSAWFFHSLEQIVDSDYAEFSVILMNSDDHKKNISTWFNNLRGNPKELVYKFFNTIDEKVFLRKPNAFETMNLQKILSGIPVVTVKPTSEGNIDVISPDDVKRVREYNLDIFIKVGFQQLCEPIITAAKYGIWFYDHTDNKTKRGGPPGFWEVVEGRPETGSVLLMVNEYPQSRRVVYRSRFLTHPFSPARNRNTSFWVSASFLPRQIGLLYRLGEARFFQETAKFNDEFDFYDRKQYQVPTNIDSLIIYTSFFVRLMSELYQRVFRLETWYLMVDFSKNTPLSFVDFNKVIPPKDRFWADPHVIHKNDRYFIFVEEYIYKNRKGHISVIDMDSQGQYKDPVPVLETGYHLSYPFVFECDEKYYMVPESAQNHTIDLYECVKFPTQWKFKMSLMNNVLAVDTTFFFHLGKWWLFTGIAENEGALPEVELFLFYSDDLFTTEWKSHPLNPVISDVTCARPAGKLFTKDGKVYRPSQDCSKTYGHGFNISEVLCLTETEYLEKKVAEVKPNWDNRLMGTHTYTSAEGINVIDGITRRRKLF